MSISNADVEIKTEKKCKYCKHYQWGDNYLSNNLHPCVRSLSSEEAEDSAVMIIGKYSQILYGPEFGCIHWEVSSRIKERKIFSDTMSEAKTVIKNKKDSREHFKLSNHIQVASEEQIEKCLTCKNAIPIGRWDKRVFFCQKGHTRFPDNGCQEYDTYEKPKSDPKEFLCKTCFNLSDDGRGCGIPWLENHAGPGLKTIACKEYFSKDGICFSCRYHYPDRENLLGIEDKPCVICLENRPKAVRLSPDAHCSDRKNVWFGGVSYHREEVIAQIIDGRKAQFREVREKQIEKEMADIDFSVPVDFHKYYQDFGADENPCMGMDFANAEDRTEIHFWKSEPICPRSHLQSAETDPEKFICYTCMYREDTGGCLTMNIAYGICRQPTKIGFTVRNSHTCDNWRKKSVKEYSEGTI